jgi:hypothetical protein
MAGVTRPARLPAAHDFRTGAVRADTPGDTLTCLVLVSGPEWVAADVETGALVRPLASEATREGAFRPARSLELVCLVLGPLGEPPDPARPEAIRVASVATDPIRRPRRRAVRHLLGHLVSSSRSGPLLGSLGPSIAYPDLEGDRPSVAVVAPDQRPRFGNGPAGPWCQFSLAGRRHAMPLQVRPEEALDLVREGPGATVPRLLVVGFGAPRRGQVPKVVLGAISEAPKG